MPWLWPGKTRLLRRGTEALHDSPLPLCRPQPWNQQTPPPSDTKGGGKGRGGKGKDKNKKQKTGKEKDGYNRTADGKPICYRYNAKNACKKGEKCHNVHTCTKDKGEPCALPFLGQG